MKNEVKELNMEELEQVYGGSRLTSFIIDTVKDVIKNVNRILDSTKPKPWIANND